MNEIMPRQQKQSEWFEQWTMLRDTELSLFVDWIYPTTLESLRDMDVLEAGCGGGQHTGFMAPYAKSITAVDLNTVSIAKERNKSHSNVTFIEGDLATISLGRQFDVVLSIGVIHHTDDPDRSVVNLARHVKPGGKLIVWVYSKEGNFLVEYGVEPLRKFFLKNLSRPLLYKISLALTAVLMAPIYTLYLLPLPFLPYFAYFQNFRRLSFRRNALNIFDKLNAPQVQFISKKRIESWFPATEFEKIHISSYCGVSWRGSGQHR